MTLNIVSQILRIEEPVQWSCCNTCHRPLAYAAPHTRQALWPCVFSYRLVDVGRAVVEIDAKFPGFFNVDQGYCCLDDDRRL